MTERDLRRFLLAVLVALVPVAWLSMRFDPYAIDGDAVSYMDIADLMGAHRWAGVVNAYWHPLYPAMLLAGRRLLHPGRFEELGAYYKVNFGIFILQALAVLAFTSALARLRGRFSTTLEQGAPPVFLLSADGLRLLGIGLLVIASQRELTLGKMRPDGLLQALLLFGFSAMLAVCAAGRGSPEASSPLAEPQAAQGGVPRAARAAAPPAHTSSADVWTGLRARVGWAALMGVSFGLAYLTKSFALLVAVLSFVAMAIVLWLGSRPSGVPLQIGSWLRAMVPSLVGFCVFAAIAGPYVAMLSHQKGRLDFGDSGGLNYAWYVGGTEKFHLEPWQTSRFGTSDVHLVHPERQLLASPGVYSYKALPWGTMPPWFDATFFNERIVTHMRLAQLAHRDVRNVALVLRYLLNHPEGWLLLGMLLVLGGRFAGGPAVRAGSQPHMPPFWALPVALGLAIWAIYGLVNVEERYVTAGYLTLLLPLFAALRVRGAAAVKRPSDLRPLLPAVATGAVVLFALLALGESVRSAAENRRQQSLRGLLPAWRDPAIFGAARGLQQMGVRPGDEIACVGTVACVYDPYWMRLAGVRTVTEIFVDDDHLAQDLAAMPRRDEAYRVVKDQGAQVLVGHFDPAALGAAGEVGRAWRRLGNTDFYALPLNLPAPGNLPVPRTESAP